MYIKIKLETFLEILYFINDWLRLMGHGREFQRLSRLIKNLDDQRVFSLLSEKDLRPFYQVRYCLKMYRQLKIELED